VVLARFQFASTRQFGQNTLLLFTPPLLEACDMKMEGSLWEEEGNGEKK